MAAALARRTRAERLWLMTFAAFALAMAPIAMRAVPARPVVAPFRRKLRHGGKGRADAFRQRLLGKPDLRQLFDVAQIGALVIGAEAESDPFRSRPRGPAAAVDILLGPVRPFEVHDMAYGVDVAASTEERRVGEE